jgi:coatomer subunit epsilon
VSSGLGGAAGRQTNRTGPFLISPSPLPFPSLRSKVLSSIKESAPPALVAVRALAQYLSSEPSSPSRSAVVAQAESWLGDVSAISSPAVQAVAATIFLHEGLSLQALKAVRSFSTLEALALSIQVYLRIDRADLAEAQLAVLQEKDDESALYQLSAAHVALALGGDRYREAVNLYQEMQQRYGEESVAVANGLAAALICVRRFDDAEKVVAEALQRDPACPETLINALSLLQHTGRGASEAAGKHLAALRRTAPKHPFVAALGVAESAFDRVAQSFVPATA